MASVRYNVYLDEDADIVGMTVAQVRAAYAEKWWIHPDTQAIDAEYYRLEDDDVVTEEMLVEFRFGPARSKKRTAEN